MPKNVTQECDSLSTSPVRCSHCTWRNFKNSFFNSKLSSAFELQLDNFSERDLICFFTDETLHCGSPANTRMI